MTIICYICGENFVKGSLVSLHRFPKEPNRRKEWMNSLGIPLEDYNNIGQNTAICSKHFDPQYIYCTPGGKRCLKGDAIPKLIADPINTSSVIRPNTLRSVPSTNLTSVSQSVQHSVINNTGNDYFPKSLSVCCELSGMKAMSPSRIVTISPSSTDTGSPSHTDTVSSSHTETVSPSHTDTVSSSHTDTASINSSPEKLKKQHSHTCNQPPEPTESFQIPGSSNNVISDDDSVEDSSHLRKRRKIRYFGDIHSSDFNTASRAKNCWRIIKSSFTKQRKIISSLRQKNQRLRKKVDSLKSVLKLLRDKHLISENVETILGVTLAGAAGEVMNRMLQGPKRQKYNPRLRAFALTLHFYSPKAYNFVREEFNNSLPHVSTITKWYQTVNGQPGFTREAFEALKIKVEDAKTRNGKVICNLVMDEMALHKKVEYVGKKVVGYVNMGPKKASNKLPMAREALVLMLVCVNGHWKIPIGYFLIDGLTAIEKANLIRLCLEYTHEIEVIVSSITFDGTATNLSMVTHLGADFSENKMQTFFLHPTSNMKIYIFLDPSHMLKLIRNCFGTHKILRIGDKFIKWNYIESLVNLQENEGLLAANKLKTRHLLWAQEKMRVKLAAQLFSKSVSDALLFLEFDLKIANFQGAEETANFLKIFNDLFDILNSRSRFAKYIFQRPLSPITKNEFFCTIDKSIGYINNLNLFDGTPVLKSTRKTGFLGFIVCGMSLKSMYETYVDQDFPLLKYILSYKFSQDHLEIFFSVIRSRGGFNNNPTCRQFGATYKKLLVHAEIKGSTNANAIALDNTSILHCSSRSSITQTEENINLNMSEIVESSDNIVQTSKDSSWCLSEYSSDIVTYIAGFVVRKIKKHITCIQCLECLEANISMSDLQKRKQFLKLTNASPLIATLCKYGEKTFRHFLKMDKINNNDILDILIVSCLNNLPDYVFTFSDHFLTDDLLDNHVTKLIKIALRVYFNLRLHHEFQKIDDVKKNVRSLLTKVILFKNQ